MYNKTIQAPSASGLTYKLLSTELALSEDYCSVRIRIDYSGESTNIAQYDVTIGDTSKENAKYLTDSLTSITGSDEFEVSLDSLSSGEGIINLTATAIATTLTADTNDSAATDEDGSYVVRTSVWNNNVCTTTTTTYASYADYEENVNNWTIKVVSVITYADSEHTTIESIETTTQTKTSSGEDSESSTQQQEPEHDLIGEAFRISVIYVK